MIESNVDIRRAKIEKRKIEADPRRSVKDFAFRIRPENIALTVRWTCMQNTTVNSHTIVFECVKMCVQKAAGSYARH